MYYLDTSFAAALILPEPNSDLAVAALRNVAPGQLSMSDWTQVEFASALARLVRTRVLQPAAAARAAAQFEKLVTASVEIFLPTRRDYIEACRYLGLFQTGLRGSDALHLAVASNRGEQILTFDRELIRAGRRLGVPVASTVLD